MTAEWVTTERDLGLAARVWACAEQSKSSRTPVKFVIWGDYGYEVTVRFVPPRPVEGCDCSICEAIRAEFGA